MIRAEKAMAKAGIINPRAPDPTSPPSAAGSSGLLSAARRDRGTCKSGALHIRDRLRWGGAQAQREPCWPKPDPIFPIYPICAWSRSNQADRGRLHGRHSRRHARPLLKSPAPCPAVLCVASNVARRFTGSTSKDTLCCCGQQVGPPSQERSQGLQLCNNCTRSEGPLRPMTIAQHSCC